MGPGEGVADPGQSQTELLKKKDWGYTVSVEGNTRKVVVHREVLRG